MIKQKEIDNYVESLKDIFLIWDNVIHKFENELSSDLDWNKKNEEPLFQKTLYVFADIIKIFIQLSNIKDEWSDPVCTWQPVGINSTVESKILDVKFSFVLYENEFLLETYIPNPKDLNKVSDNFWFNLLQLRNYGNFEFEGEEPDKYYNNINIEKRFKTKSNIFRLVKNFIFLDLSDDMLVNLATLQLKWSRNTSWRELIRNGCCGFELLYKIDKEIISKDKLK